MDVPGNTRVWLKRTEQAQGRMRLQKGDGQRALVAEREALRVLHAAGVAVPEVLAEGVDFILLPDLGPNLSQIVARGLLTPDERVAAFAAAGAALAGMHRAGFAHGRPALRDFCWRDGQLRMIDLERFRNRKSGTMRRALDVVIFTHSWFALPQSMRQGSELEAALSAYRAAAPRGLWSAVGRWTQLLRPLDAIASWVARKRPGSAEVEAVSPAIACLRDATRFGD